MTGGLATILEQEDQMESHGEDPSQRLWRTAIIKYAEETFLVCTRICIKPVFRMEPVPSMLTADSRFGLTGRRSGTTYAIYDWVLEASSKSNLDGSAEKADAIFTQNEATGSNSTCRKLLWTTEC